MFRNLSVFTTIGLIVVGISMFVLALIPVGLILWALGAIFAVGSGVFFWAFSGLIVGMGVGFALASDYITRRLKQLYFYVKIKYGI